MQAGRTGLRWRFPGNREFSREFADVAPRGRDLAQNRHVISNDWDPIPCTIQQGICHSRTGIFLEQTGNFIAGSGKCENRSGSRTGPTWRCAASPEKSTRQDAVMVCAVLQKSEPRGSDCSDTGESRRKTRFGGLMRSARHRRSAGPVQVPRAFWPIFPLGR
jgi:hypothetical protein